MKTDDLTPEQRQALIDAGAALTRAAADIITAMTNAIAPIMDWYNSLPDEIKQQVAASQVAKEHPTLFPAKPIGDKPDRDQWIINKLETEYKQYWNEEQQRYVIIEPGKDQGDGTSTGDEIWKPTRDELLADLERSYDFEFSS